MEDMTETFLSIRDQLSLERIEKRKEREAAVKRTALALLQQCKDEGFTVEDVNQLCKIVQFELTKLTLRDGLTLG